VAEHLNYLTGTWNLVNRKKQTLNYTYLPLKSGYKNDVTSCIPKLLVPLTFCRCHYNTSRVRLDMVV
jgi:hypothetical protein